MGRSPSITIGNAGEGLRVEHVKTKGLVRLVRWQRGRAEDDVLGLEVSDFCARLGITTDVLGPPPRRYLFVADPGHGAGRLLTLVDSEREARAQFISFRQSEHSPGAWAEVCEITTGHGMRRICWFGPSGPSRTQPVDHGPPGPRRRRWRLLRSDTAA